MEVNREGDRPGSITKRRSSLRLVEPQFEPIFERMDTPEGHLLVAQLPGFKTEDVKVQVDDQGNIVISGERSVEELIFVGGNWHPRLRPGFKFRKVFSIPKTTNITSISTKIFENELFHFTINTVRPSLEINSTNILDQERKNIPQVGEINASIEESKEKKDDEAQSGKPNKNLTDGKGKTLEVAKSTETQVDKVPSNKLVQSTKDEKDETVEVVNFSATQDDKALLSITNDQNPRDDKVETSRVGKYSTTQDDTTLSNKLDQSQKDKKVETKGTVESSTAQDSKAPRNDLNQFPKDEKVENLQDTKPVVVQGEQESINRPNQSPIDEKGEILKVVEASTNQQYGEKFKTPKATNSNAIQDAMLGTKLQEPNKTEELAKHIPLLNEETFVGSNVHLEQFESLDFDQEEVQMKGGDQYKDDLVENIAIKSKHSNEDHVQEMQVSREKVKEEGKGGEDKKSILQICPYVSLIISPRRDFMISSAIIVFSISFYIAYTLKYI